MRMKTSITWILLILIHLSNVFGHGYDTGDFDGWYQPVPHRPVDIITDVVNDLGVRILQQYTAHGNVAFSPMGVGFVLAALYEGSASRTCHEISEALGLPRDRDITRIGFRDIHRRLRTYLNADGFLGGLTLNQENTKLRPEYEEVLKFYGFDLSVENEHNHTTTAPETTPPSESTEMVTESDASSETVAGTTTPSTTAQLTDGTSSGTETSTSFLTSPTSPIEMVGMTLSTMNVQDRLTQITSAGTSPPVDTTVNGQTLLNTNGETTIAQTTVPSTAVTTMDTVPGTLSETTTSVNDSSSVSSTDPIAMSTTVTGQTSLNVNGQTTIGQTTVPTTATSTIDTTPGTLSVNDSSSVPTTDTIALSTTLTTMVTTGDVQSSDANTTSQSMNTNEQSTTSNSVSIANSNGATTPIGGQTGTTVSDQTTSGIESTTTATMTNTDGDITTLAGETILSSDSASITASQSTSTSIVDNPTIPTTGPPTDENTVATDLSTNQTVSEATTTETSSTNLPSTNMMTDNGTTVANAQNSITPSTSPSDDSTNTIRKRSIRKSRGYFTSYPDEGIWMQDLGIWKPYSPGVSEASVRDSTEISFLVNGCDVSSIAATRYVAVLPFAYFPSLHAVAVEFPLDDPRYNILLLMSTNRRDTYRLARDLGGKSLRLLRKQLQPTWVRATIPSFMLRGFVTLTPYLERLGIVDVFEPRMADLSPMTPDLGVYVRDIQQSIGVNIRNYMKPDRTHSRNGLFERAGPVPFTVVHPFLYFIVDAETSVALIAGRVNDPLNSRIL